jgi:hypothetical protein
MRTKNAFLREAMWKREILLQFDMTTQVGDTRRTFRKPNVGGSCRSAFLVVREVC